MVHDGAMNDVIWYSRFAVLVGALILLVQSLSGRALNWVTLVAVLMVCAGLIVFLASLALENADTTSFAFLRAEVDEASDTVSVGGSPTTAPAPVPRRSTPDAAESISHAAPPVAVTAPTPNVPTSTPTPLERVRTVELRAGSDALVTVCPRCDAELTEGQVAALCPRCGEAHHATCWIENHFHCSTLSCEGRGSLEAPVEDVSR